MKLLLKGALTLLLLQLSFTSRGQTASQSIMTNEITERIRDVYGNDFVINNQTLVSAYSEMLTTRIEFRTKAQDPSEKYPLLSSYPVYNKVNPSIQGADFQNFNAQLFNPLTYNLEFFSKLTQIIRIDNTDYVMIIHPVNQTKP